MLLLFFVQFPIFSLDPSWHRIQTNGIYLWRTYLVTKVLCFRRLLFWRNFLIAANLVLFDTVSTYKQRCQTFEGIRNRSLKNEIILKQAYSMLILNFIIFLPKEPIVKTASNKWYRPANESSNSHCCFHGKIQQYFQIFESGCKFIWNLEIDFFQLRLTSWFLFFGYIFILLWRHFGRQLLWGWGQPVKEKVLLYASGWI